MDHRDLERSLLRNHHHPAPDADEPPRPPNTVYARWDGYDGGNPTGPEDFFQKTYVYVVTIPPSEPLAIGRRVRVLTTTPSTWVSGPDADPNLHGAQDAHIVGRVTKLIGWKGKLVALAVENECRENLVRRARLEIPYVPDVTVARLESLRSGRGPKEAGLDDLDLAATVQPLQPGWSCDARYCMLREHTVPMTLQAGVFAVFVFGGAAPAGLEKRKAGEQEGPATKRKRRGKLEAVGWRRDQR